MPSFSAVGLVGTLRPRLFFVRLGTGTGSIARDLGPRRSSIGTEAPKKVYWAGGGGGGVAQSFGSGAGSDCTDVALDKILSGTGTLTLMGGDLT
jgi:hypothetical protein